ncbi:organic cation transporter protein-like isoform X2 [Tachypleus tridentatus]|uniref:organic cation transporter protein-like isoform X2 n=1 Tax=Tachypleus tridentatus TaxID=6853 RepID=UPI003FD27DBD
MKSPREDITLIMGGTGPWQRRVFLLIFVATLPNAWHILVTIFLAPNIDHWCGGRPDVFHNMSEVEWKNFSVPVVAQETGQRSFSKCWMYDVMNNTNLNNTREVHYCFEWEYDHTQYKSSIVEQWNLVCNNSWMISLSQMFYMSGYLVSSFITGQLSDRFGRRPIILLSIATGSLSGILCALSPSFIIFVILRFFVALGVTGIVTSSFVLLMEIIDQSQRSTLGIAFQMGWAVGFLTLSVLAWFIRDWTYLQLSISVPLLALAGHWWLLPESPRFLLSHRRFQEAEHELKKALITNGKDPSNLPSIMSKLVANVENENSTYKEKTILDLLKVPKWRKKSLAVFSIWFAISFIYFGLSFNTNNLGGDPFLNFVIAGAVEFPSYFGTIFVVKRLGRKFPLMISVIIAGVALLLIIPVPYGYSCPPRRAIWVVWSALLTSRLSYFNLTRDAQQTHCRYPRRRKWDRLNLGLKAKTSLTTTVLTKYNVFL